MSDMSNKLLELLDELEKVEYERDAAIEALRDLREQYKLFVTNEDAIGAFHLVRSNAVLAAYDARKKK